MKRGLLFLGLFLLLTLASCNKNENTIFRVYVAKNGQPKINAQVRIYGVHTVNPPTLDIVDYTDANGLIEFNLNNYIKSGSYGGMTLDCYVSQTKTGPVDTVFTVFVKGFETTKSEVKF